MELKVAFSEEDIWKCHEVLQFLRPHLVEKSLVTTVKQMMSEGYELAYIQNHSLAVAAIGYRYLQFLFNGKHYYIDDLCTLPAYRGQGYAGRLLDFVIEKGRAKGYKNVTLDSGYFERSDAHRLYLNKGFVLSSHHFSLEI